MLTSQSEPLAAAIKRMPDAPTANNLQKCDRSGFYYYQITKCGCTFVRALINQIDGRPHDAEPQKVMWDNDAALAFVVVRHPIDRFLSLYFDKMYGGSSQMAKSFIQRGIITPDAHTVAEHEENCLRALAWIKQTVDSGKIGQMNVHWRPQKYRLHKISKLNVHMLTLDGLSWQMTHLLHDYCPDIATQIQRCGHKNVSLKPIDPDLLKTERIQENISGIYPDDERIYADVNRH